jgi:hypothetical protein
MLLLVVWYLSSGGTQDGLSAPLRDLKDQEGTKIFINTQNFRQLYEGLASSGNLERFFYGNVILF